MNNRPQQEPWQNHPSSFYAFLIAYTTILFGFSAFHVPHIVSLSHMACALLPLCLYFNLFHARLTMNCLRGGAKQWMHAISVIVLSTLMGAIIALPIICVGIVVAFFVVDMSAVSHRVTFASTIGFVVSFAVLPLPLKSRWRRRVQLRSFRSVQDEHEQAKAEIRRLRKRDS